MKKTPEIDEYINTIAEKCSNKDELIQIATSNIYHSLKKMNVLSERIKKEILEGKSKMSEIQLLILGLKIEMINSEIKKIRHEFLS